jgi:hypothetical protein
MATVHVVIEPPVSDVEVIVEAADAVASGGLGLTLDDVDGTSTRQKAIRVDLKKNPELNRKLPSG